MAQDGLSTDTRTDWADDSRNRSDVQMNKRKLVTNREDTTMKFNISGMFDNTLSIVIAALLAALFPLAEIWSINTLFNTNIEYNFTTWMAAVILSGALSSRFILKGV